VGIAQKREPFSFRGSKIEPELEPIPKTGIPNQNPWRIIQPRVAEI
jgi:hypothetical protein